MRIDSDSKLVARAMANARNSTRSNKPLWSVVMDLFGCGSTMARMLCEMHGRDPDVNMPCVCDRCRLIEEED